MSSSSTIADAAEASPSATGNNESNEEYEDVYISLTFPDFNDTNFLDGKVLKIKGICSSEPKCEIEDNEFKGRHELSLGSQLFFSDDEAHNSDFVAMAIKHINFSLSHIGKLKDVPSSKCRGKGKQMLRQKPVDYTATATATATATSNNAYVVEDAAAVCSDHSSSSGDA